MTLDEFLNLKVRAEQCANKEVLELVCELEQVRKERDAAVSDLLDAAIMPCDYCAINPSNGGSCDMKNENHEMFSCWQWRGLNDWDKQ